MKPPALARLFSHPTYTKANHPEMAQAYSAEKKGGKKMFTFLFNSFSPSFLRCFLSAHNLYNVTLSPIHFRLIVFQWLCKCSFSSLSQCRFRFRLNSSLYFVFAHGHHRWGSTLMDFSSLSLSFFYWSKKLGEIEKRISVMLYDERTGSMESGQGHRKPNEALEGRSKASEEKNFFAISSKFHIKFTAFVFMCTLASLIRVPIEPMIPQCSSRALLLCARFLSLLSLCRAKWKIIWWQNRKKQRRQLREKSGGGF